MELRSRNLVMRAWRVAATCICVGLVLGGRSASAGEDTHKYEENDQVTVWLNKIGPRYNPQETYSYYSLPFCRVEGFQGSNQKKKSGFGEVLAGHKLRNSGIDIKFKVDQPVTTLCSRVLNDRGDLEEFIEAVERIYLANFYVDDLPLYFEIGKPSQNTVEVKTVPQIYVHQRYTIKYNEDRIIQVQLIPGNGVDLVLGATLEFTYQVEWISTEDPFSERFHLYLSPDFYEHRIHVFSIFNAFMMVIFLCGLVALILVRTLKQDFAKYTGDDDELEGPDTSLNDDSGWKQVHGDVFRAPQQLMLFSALHGTGCQIAVLVFSVILFAMAGKYHGEVYEKRGEMVSSFIVCYALTSFISGYTSGSYYRQFFTTPRAEQSSQWQRTMLLSVMIVPSVVFPMVFILNLVAMSYNTVNTIPFTTVLEIALLWLFVSFPLCVTGSMFGRHWGGKGNFPCRVNSIPRQIPEGAWYAKPSVVIPLAGILPFGSVFFEMYFILTSLTSYSIYNVYGFMVMVFLILIVVLVCVSIVSVYVVLNAENYHWQWLSFLSAGSTAGYMFLYSVYYFLFKTMQSGFMQISFYFGYMGMFCAALFVMCGSIGLMGSTVFVKQIYRNIKAD